MKAKVKVTRWVRRIVQIAFLVLVVVKAWQHMNGDKGAFATLDGLCPFGALETMAGLIRSGKYLSKLAPSNIVLAVALILSAVTAGAVFCGWICPLGTIGDWLTALRHRLGIKELRVKPGVDRPLRHFRYLVLITVLAATYRYGTLVFAGYDPYRTIFGLHWIFDPSEIALTGVLMTGTVLIAMFFIPRAWCRYACPLGATLSLIGRLRIMRLHQNTGACSSCTLCNRACPMGLDVEHGASESGQCIGCLECAGSCPGKAIGLEIRKRSLKPTWLPAAGVAVLVVGVSAGMISGLWVSSQRGMALRDQAENKLEAADIKGWMTFQDVSELYHIPVDELLAAVQSPGGFTATTPLRELEQVGSEPAVIRDFVANYGSKAFKDGSKETLPGDSAKTAVQDDGGETSNVQTESAGEPAVKGSMTLAEISDQFGISLKSLIDGMSLPSDVDLGVPVRDLKNVYGFEMQTLRDLVETLKSR